MRAQQFPYESFCTTCGTVTIHTDGSCTSCLQAQRAQQVERAVERLLARSFQPDTGR